MNAEPQNWPQGSRMVAKLPAEGPPQPHSMDAEQGLLACCLVDGGAEVLTECQAQNMRPEYFYHFHHQIIFAALLALNATGLAPDEMILANKLTDAGQLDAIGGHAALYALTARVQTTVHAKHWMQVVREKFFLRQLIRTAQWTVEQAHGVGTGDVMELLNHVESEFFKIQNDQLTDDAVPTPELVDRVNANIAKTLARNGQLNGLPTGLTDLDRILSGLKPSEVIVLGARTSQGKTGLSINIAEHLVLPPRNAKHQPTPVLIFSIEMSAEQLMQRLICSHARVDMRRLQDGFCDRQSELILSSRLAAAAPLFIEAPSSPTIAQIRAKARRYARKHKLGLIIVDYLQLVRATTRGTTREQEVAEVSRGLKAMAKELNVAVLALAQLGRSVEKDNRRPRLSDFRESGSLEQDADVCLLIAKPSESDDETEQGDILRRQIIIAKNRNGPVGEVSTIFNRRLCQFQNYVGEPQ